MLSRGLVVSLFIFIFVERIQCGNKQDGRYCLENEIFDKKSNTCRGCPPGYFGINCQKSCPAGHYGNGCQSLCLQACLKTCVFTTGKCKQPGNQNERQTMFGTTSQSHAGTQSQRKHFSISQIVTIFGSVFVFILTTVLIYYIQKILRRSFSRNNQDNRRISLTLTEDKIYEEINENILPT